MAATPAPNSAENSTRGDESMNLTLPFKKAASPGHSNRVLTPGSREGGGRGRSGNGVPCPFSPVDGLLCPGCCNGRLLFRPLRRLHVSLHLVKALPPPERRFPCPLMSPPRKLEFLHRRQGAVVGVSVVGRALSLARCRARGDQPLAFHRSWRGLALMSLRARGRLLRLRLLPKQRLLLLVALRSGGWCGDPSEVPPPTASVPGVCLL